MQLTVRFEPSRREVRVAPGTTLLAAARLAGLPVASACGAGGACARCGMRILSGGSALVPADARERRARERNRIDPALRLSCRVELRGDCVATAPYW